MLNFFDNLYFLETLPSCSIEIIALIFFVINLFFAIFLKRLTKAQRLSNYSIILSLLLCIGFSLGYNFFNVENPNFDFFGIIFSFDKPIYLYKAFAFALFGLIFFAVSGFIRKCRYKIPFLNSLFCLIMVISSLIISCKDNIFSFVLLDLLVFFIYKFASSMRLKKEGIYSIDFILMNALSSVVFYTTSYCLRYADSDVLVSALNIVLLLSFVLKIGIFPFANYLLIKNHKGNIPYLVLNSLYLPFVSLFVFSNIFQGLAIYEVYVIVSCAFLLFNLILTSVLAVRFKDIVKFILSFGQIYTLFALFAFVCLQNNEIVLEFGFCAMTAVLGSLSLFLILKLNNPETKITLKSLQGFVFSNRKLCNLIVLSLLMLVCILPSALLQNGVKIASEIYSFDKIGYFFVVAFLFVFASLINRVFVLILNIYQNVKLRVYKNNKKATWNIAAFLLSIIILLVFLL